MHLKSVVVTPNNISHSTRIGMKYRKFVKIMYSTCNYFKMLFISGKVSTISNKLYNAFIHIYAVTFG